MTVKGVRFARIERKCLRCGKEILVFKSSIKRGGGKYCSMSCARGNPPVTNKCKICGKKFSFNLSRVKQSKKSGNYCSKHCSMIDMGDKRFKAAGDQNPAWKGGITKQHFLRTTNEYSIWRKAVLERDGFICQHCGRAGGALHAHHIRPFAIFPELRMDILNGITLCKNCHKDHHKKRRD